MNYFNKTSYQHIFETLVSYVVLAAIALSAIPAQAVNAVTDEVMVTSILPVLSVKNIDLSALESETALFPEIQPAEPKRTMWVVATAYSSDPWQTDSSPCTPAMSHFDMCAEFVETGVADTIATNMLPLGTKVKFPDLYGDKVFVVRDRMNAKYNGTNRIDFWIGSEQPTNQTIIRDAKQKAIQFGVKRLKMEIYNK